MAITVRYINTVPPPPPQNIEIFSVEPQAFRLNSGHSLLPTERFSPTHYILMQFGIAHHSVSAALSTHALHLSLHFSHKQSQHIRALINGELPGVACADRLYRFTSYVLVRRAGAALPETPRLSSAPLSLSNKHVFTHACFSFAKTRTPCALLRTSSNIGGRKEEERCRAVYVVAPVVTAKFNERIAF